MTALSTYSGQFVVWHEGQDITTGNGVVYSVLEEVGCDATINRSTGVYTLESVSDDSAYAIFKAVYNGQEIKQRFSVAKSRAGSDGSPAKLVTVNASRLAFTYDKNGQPSPADQSVIFSATRQNTSSQVSWSVQDGTGAARTPVTDYLSSASGDVVTMSLAQFVAAKGSTNSAKVIGTITDGQSISDSISIYQVQDGADGADGPQGPSGPTGPTGPQGPAGAPAITASLNPEILTVTAYSNGTVANYSGMSATMKFLVESSDVSSSFNLSIVGNPYNLTASISGRTVTITGAGTGEGEFGNPSVDTATLTIRATGTGAYAGRAPIDKILTISKNKVGIEPVSSLPTANLFVGRIVFHTGAEKLYRYTSSGWTAAVPSTDIVGQLESAQISDQAVTATKFANSLKPVEVLSSLPTSGNVAGRMVYLTGDSKLYRWTGSQWTAEVPAADITGQITATQITDNAITSPKIAAGSITASKLSIGDSSNMVPDPQCIDPSAWVTTGGIGVRSTPTGHMLPSSHRLVQDSASDATNHIVTADIPVEAGKEYHVLMTIGSHSYEAISITGYINWYNLDSFGNKTYITSSTVVPQDTTTGLRTNSAIVTAPTNARLATISARKNAGSLGTLTVGGVVMRRAAAGELIVDGAISADKIQSNAITAGKIQAGAVTTDALASKSITTSKLAVFPDSILPDPYFQDTAWWTEHGWDTDGWYFEDASTGANNATNLNTTRCVSLVVGPAGRKHMWGRMMPLSGDGLVLRLRGKARNYSTDWVQVTVRFYAHDGVAKGAYLGDISINFPANSGYTTQVAQAAVPTGAAYYQTIIYNSGSTQRVSTPGISSIKLDYAASAELIVDGAVISDKIATNAITVDKILAGAVTASKLNVTSLSSITANVGTLTAGVIRNASDSYRMDVTNGRTIMKSGGSMKVSGAPFGSGNQFLEWFGPYLSNLSQCTETNATYYLKTNGDAYFGGSLSAGVLNVSVRNTQTGVNPSVSTGPFTSNGGTRRVVVSFDRQSNVTHTSLTDNSTQSSATLQLLRGSTIVQSVNITGSKQFSQGFSQSEPGSWSDSLTGSFTFTDNTGGTSVTYTARIINQVQASPPSGSIGAGNVSQALSLTATEE